MAPLEFLGFRPGTSLSEIERRARTLGATGLGCDRARRDPRVMECRAIVSDSMTGRAVELWLSAIDSAAAIVTISGPVDPDQLTGWRTHLESGYGGAGIRVQGTQSMMQWIRGRQMLRLTWRMDQPASLASVSLVDGPLLDGWGRQRDRQR